MSAQYEKRPRANWPKIRRSASRRTKILNHAYTVNDVLTSLQITDDQLDELYEGLGVDLANQPQIRAHSLFVQALKPVNVYEIEK